MVLVGLTLKKKYDFISFPENLEYFSGNEYKIQNFSIKLSDHKIIESLIWGAI